MTNVNNNYKADYTGALTYSLGTGALLGGVEYSFRKRPFLSEKKLNDTFTKTIEGALVKINDKATLENINLKKAVDSEINALKSSTELIAYANKNMEKLGGAECLKKEILSSLKTMDLNNSKKALRDFYRIDGDYKKYYNGLFESCCDSSGKLVHDAQKISKEKFDIIKKAASNYRIKSALKSAAVCAGICATINCIAELYKSRKK